MVELLLERGVRGVLADTSGVLRLTELLEETDIDELDVRQELDTLVLQGEVERFPVGEHIMIRPTDKFDPTSRTSVDN